MNKKAFTLVELILVIIIIAAAGVSTTVIFRNVLNTDKEAQAKQIYKDIQRAALIYIDINEEERTTLFDEGNVSIKVGKLQEEGYLSSDLTNPIDNSYISPDYVVKLSVEDNSYVSVYLYFGDDKLNESFNISSE